MGGPIAPKFVFWLFVKRFGKSSGTVDVDHRHRPTPIQRLISSRLSLTPLSLCLLLPDRTDLSRHPFSSPGLCFAVFFPPPNETEQKSASTPVDYISPKRVKKLGGGGPGMVKFEGAKVVRGEPAR